MTSQAIQDHPATPLLKVRGLEKIFVTKGKGWRQPDRTFRAVDKVNFDVMPGETLGIVGESGSGKTTTVRCILRALEPDAGSAILQAEDGPVDLLALSERQLKPLRREMQMIFQDPYASLNPRMTVADIVGEPLLIHGMRKRSERVERVAAMLERVGLQADHMYRYPHAFSGGQRQRVGIARALILQPKLVVADESVSALDVSVQARVLDLLKELQQEMGLTYIFVAHDLAVVKAFCDRVAVMHGGQIKELAPARQLFEAPQHAYTKVLLSAIPYPDPNRKLQPLSVSDLSEEELRPLPELR